MGSTKAAMHIGQSSTGFLGGGSGDFFSFSFFALSSCHNNNDVFTTSFTHAIT